MSKHDFDVGGILLFALASGIGLAWLLIKYDGDGGVIDQLGDFLVDFSQSDEQKLSQLEPDTQAKVRLLINNLANGVLDDTGTLRVIRIHIGQGKRTPAQEKAVIAAGRSAIGEKDHSYHEVGRAVDLYPINPDTGEPDLNGVRDDLFRTMHEAAWNVGLGGLAYSPYPFGSRRLINGKKGPIWDGGHVQNPGPYSSANEAWEAEGNG